MPSSKRAKVPAELRGMDLLDTPIWNKGTAFNDNERAIFGLHGLLPPRVESLEEQVARAYEAFGFKRTDLERHIYLRQLQDTNESLFYRLMLDHIEEMMPIVTHRSSAWPASSSVTSIAGLGVFSFPIRCAIRSPESYRIVLTRRSMSS
jgi:hypothetical protein